MPYVGCDNLMIDFTVCQLLGHGQAAVPVFSAEVSSASVSFCCVTTTPQLDSSQTATSLPPGSRPFLFVLSYLGISDPPGFYTSPASSCTQLCLSESRGLLDLRNPGNWAQICAHSFWALKHAQLACSVEAWKAQNGHAVAPAALHR